ncbi:MAG: hydroxyethylthiazole kinase [Oscillospiraceae bacterium]|nr:hydroxyethylthiazole kinase [Oscillospiraceae bacterium]
MHSLLNNIRTRKPLVHCITNYVTANDCANLLLAGGAVPVMADAPEDAAEITSAAQALVLNLGTLSRSRLQAMLLAGKAANLCGIPVVLDPVGVWAASFRYGAAKQLLHEVQFAAVRGNLQEIDTVLTIVCGSHCMPEAEPPAVCHPRTLAALAHTKVICTGAEDIVTDGETVFRCRNGHPILRQITGAGCMLSALTGAFLAAENSVESCAAAVCAMGLAGELAASRMTPRDGNASCRTYLIDAVYNMTDEQLEEGAKLEHLT